MTVRLIEGQVPYTGGTAIEITADKVINLLLRAEDNLLHVNGNNELYCDLQLENGLAPTDDFPVGVTTGIVNENDGWDQNGLLLHYETTSGAYAQWLYGADGKLYFDGGTGTFKLVYYADDVDGLIQNLANQISAVGYSGEYADLLHRPGIVEVSYSLADDEWIANGTIIDNCTVMITPYQNEVPAQLVIDGITYQVLGNDGNDLTVYGTEPLVCLYQTNGVAKYFNTFLRAYDSALSSTSENAVQNKVIKAELDLKADAADIGNAALTIQQNGTQVAQFTANANQPVTANITVPTALSDLTNDVVNDGNLTIKRNHTTIAEFSANDATNVIADISVPEVANNTTTPDSTMALSALMGKELQDQINHLQAQGRFLSIWDCTTGLPQTNPTTLPYLYNTGDYFLVGVVNSGGTNYRPDGNSYTGVASTTVETVPVGVGNMYVYDGTNWILQLSGGQSYPIDNVLSNTSTNAVENRVVTNALNQKQDTLIAGNGINIDANDEISVDTTVVATQTDLGNKANKTDVLEKTNTTSYTPSGDYNPATKKYVDDNIVQKGSSSPNNPVQGTLWYDTVNDELKSYNGTSWETIYKGDVNGPSSSTDGHLAVFDGVTGKLIKDGGVIPIGFNPGNAGTTGQVLTKTANGYEFANAPEGNTKTFFITNSNQETTVIQEAYTWVANGGQAILQFPISGYGRFYISEAIDGTGTLTFNAALNYRNFKNNQGYTLILCNKLEVYATNGVVTSHQFAQTELLTVIEPYATYTTPFIPTQNYHPATKKYVDDKAGDGTKVFTLSNTSDTTNAQAAFDYYTAGGIPVIKMSNGYYHIANYMTASNLQRLDFTNSRSLGTSIGFGTIRIDTDSNGTVTSITEYSNEINLSNVAPGSGTGNTVITLVS